MITLPRPLLLASLLLAPPACGSPGDDPEDTDGPATTAEASTSGASTGEPTGGSTGPAEACVEDDLMAMPFAGPGFDPENGGLQEPLQDRYVSSSTVLVMRPEKTQALQETVAPMIPVLMATPGFVGFSTASSMKCGTARTLTLWRDEAAMMAFVMSDEHIAGMSKGPELSTTGTVTAWEVAREEVPVSWETAIARVTAATPSY